MSQTAKGSSGGVRELLQQLRPEERERLVRALADVLMEQLRERRRVESLRGIK